MSKCCASQDGICRNSILLGTKCDGYKERCTLRPCYESLEKVVKGCQHNLRKSWKEAMMENFIRKSMW
nr:MAG TPA: hypothetical protein [Caudoviricetes sp.]